MVPDPLFLVYLLIARRSVCAEVAVYLLIARRSVCAEVAVQRAPSGRTASVAIAVFPPLEVTWSSKLFR
jgi:hypothetical protein